ncbi:PREDICTED: receptor-like protein 12 [Populus euphratica]|uniref:Receptor-like protein 12 n=1 Tax=Populus euphratica TaxID=75702 RepID=A0AAJ6UX42_POPEU|nr:PREDICTED: receptor-like protein 12 [Populus euphratica]
MSFTISFLLLMFSPFQIMLAYSSGHPACHSEERSALLQFKESFVISRSASKFPFAYPKVQSWKLDGNGSDCCLWDGVECDEDSGHVIELDLNASCLYGSIDSNISLFLLVQLRKLNLANNDFGSSQIPSALDISFPVPDTFANLSSLRAITLINCGLQGKFPEAVLQLPNLQYLDMRHNPGLTGPLPASIGRIHSLESLMICSCNFSGVIPFSVGNLSKLSKLVLGNYSFYGQIPFSIGNLTELFYIRFALNKFQGFIPDSIFALKNLEYLNFQPNNLSGMIEIEKFLTLRSLKILYLSRNNFVLLNKSCTNGTDLPKLTRLGLAACSLSVFPNFLYMQNRLTFLDLSLNYLYGRIPSWIWKVSTEKLEFLDLSYNLLTGLDQPPAFLPWSCMSILKLNSNMLQGSLPIPPISTKYYLISNNSLAGEIPPSICNNSSFIVLDLSKNNLTGLIPQCLGNFSSTLSLLSLEGNNLYGTIPQTWVQGSRLRMISLGQNKLQGQIPTSIIGCKMLEILDPNNNQLIDTFPSWMGTLPELRIVILRHNGFHGKIGNPESSFSFQMLQILDLSLNNFTGKLPVEYFHCWFAMQVDREDRLSYMNAETSVRIQGRWIHVHYSYSMTMTNKGVEMEYKKILEILTVIELSCNKFEGEIPEYIGNLKGLRLLILSNNIFSVLSHHPCWVSMLGLSGEPFSNKCGSLKELPALAPAPATGDELL